MRSPFYTKWYGRPASLSDKNVLVHHCGECHGAMPSCLGIHQFMCPKFHCTPMKLDKSEEGCLACNNAHLERNKKVKAVAEKHFEILKAAGEYQPPASTSLPVGGRKKDRKIIKKQQKGLNKVIGTPAEVLKRVEESLPIPPENPLLKHLDEEIRFLNKMSGGVLKDEKILAEMLKNPTDKVEYDGLVNNVVNQLRPLKKQDTREVGLLYPELENIIRSILETDHQEDIAVRQRRIDYAHHLATKRGLSIS